MPQASERTGMNEKLMMLWLTDILFIFDRQRLTRLETNHMNDLRVKRSSLERTITISSTFYIVCTEPVPHL